MKLPLTGEARLAPAGGAEEEEEDLVFLEVGVLWDLERMGTVATSQRPKRGPVGRGVSTAFWVWRMGELTHDGETGGDDAYAWLDGGPDEDACETIGGVEMSRRDQFDDADDGYGADAGGGGNVGQPSYCSQKGRRLELTGVPPNDLQKPEQEYPRQRKLLRPIRPQGPNHRHRQAQNHDISDKVTDTGSNREGDSIQTSCRLGILCFKVPESVYWHALKDVGEEDGDPPGDDDDGSGVDGYSKATRRRKETVVEQE